MRAREYGEVSRRLEHTEIHPLMNSVHTPVGTAVPQSPQLTKTVDSVADDPLFAAFEQVPSPRRSLAQTETAYEPLGDTQRSWKAQRGVILSKFSTNRKISILVRVEVNRIFKMSLGIRRDS